MLHEEVVARLRHCCSRAKSPPGTRVPGGPVPAFGISPNSLREALKVMAAEGLVVLLPNRGARGGAAHLQGRPGPVRGVRGLEAVAGELACGRITDDELQAIAALHEQMLDHFRERDLVQYFIVAIARSTRAIIRAADNAVLSNLYESVTARIRAPASSPR